MFLSFWADSSFSRTKKGGPERARLRRDYLELGPGERIKQVSELSRFMSRVDAELDGAGDFEEAELPDPLAPDILALRGNWVLQTSLGASAASGWLRSRIDRRASR